MFIPHVTPGTNRPQGIRGGALGLLGSRGFGPTVAFMRQHGKPTRNSLNPSLTRSGECIMKHLIVASIGVLAIGLTTANAADIRGRPPVYRPPTPAPPPVCYASWPASDCGGHIGGVGARKEWTVRDPAFPSFLGQSDGSHRADGFLG